MKKEKEYTGENNKLFLFNDKITIFKNVNGVRLPYLVRRTLFSFSKYFSIKLHKILLGDGLCGHDHPWPFFTVILKGGYFEWTPQDQKEKGEILERRFAPDGVVEVKRWHGAGSVMYRPANWRHTLELPLDENGKPIPTNTFVITGREYRDWGFFINTGWIFWKNVDIDKRC